MNQKEVILPERSPSTLVDVDANNNAPSNEASSAISAKSKSIVEKSTSTSSRLLRVAITSAFLISMAWHSFHGTWTRRELASRRLSGRDHGSALVNDVAVVDSSELPRIDDATSSRGSLRSRSAGFAVDDNNFGNDAFVASVERPWPLLTPRRDNVPSNSSSSSSSERRRKYYKTIFRNAHKAIYNPKTPLVARQLSETNEGEAAASTTSEGGEFTETQEEEDLAEELSIEVSYEDTYDILVFLGVAYIFGEIAFHIGVPPLVGQIVAGFLLGPQLADYVPFPEAMVLLGDLGLILLLIEAGIELDVGLVKEAGIRPVLIAVAGSIIPFAIGMGLSLAQGQSVKSSIACGACFSPTSLGVAANALSGGKALNTPVGQLIVASAVIDDMIGLIILSMLEVLVAEDPALYEYFIPIISAVGYLIVLGISAITWIPRVVQHKILPRFSPENRPYVSLALLWMLVMAYLPIMYYSRASHLTGAFLAGLSFSQVEGVHHTFVNEAGSIMEWLLRIFFSASIGFQVPVKMFGNSRVVAWGFAFYVAVLGKLPVGLFAPKYAEGTPKDYPFSPYVRDVVITSVAMTCRGEFSFIIAAFGIGELLLDAELYSAIIFAVLLSSITSPIFLTLILKYYNRMASKYIEQDQLDKSGVGGKAPLHVNIQIRSAVMPGMQGSIKRCVNSLGLFVIDQRSWQPRGLSVVVATELYAVDSKTTVDIGKTLKKIDSMKPLMPATEKKDKSGSHVSIDEEPTIIPEDDEVIQQGPDPVALRCEEIRQALLNCPDLVDANVKVLQWVPLADALDKQAGLSASETATKREQILLGEVSAALKNKETIDTLVDEAPKAKKTRFKMLSGPVSWGYAEQEREKAAEAERIIADAGVQTTTAPIAPAAAPVGESEEGIRRRPRRAKMVSSPAVGGADLWGEDLQAQAAAARSAPPPPVQYDMNSGIRYGVTRRQKMKSDLSVIAESTPTIEERLDGLVRQRID